MCNIYLSAFHCIIDIILYSAICLTCVYLLRISIIFWYHTTVDILVYFALLP